MQLYVAKSIVEITKGAVLATDSSSEYQRGKEAERQKDRETERPRDRDM